jgi:hypothetical protein
MAATGNTKWLLFFRDGRIRWLAQASSLSRARSSVRRLRSWHGCARQMQRASISRSHSQSRLITASTSRAAHRLPLLPLLGRTLGECRHSGVEHVHPVSQRHMDQFKRVQRRATERRGRTTVGVESRRCASGIRVLQSCDSREQGRGLRDVPRPRRPDGPGPSSRADDDELVRELSS